MISFWIQHADFESEEAEARSGAVVAEALLAHDWDAEVARIDALKAEGAEWCPPGLGLNSTERGILHVYFEGGTETADVMVVPPRRRSLLGLFAGRSKPQYARAVPRAAWRTWVERYVAKDAEWLVANSTP